ncbi:MAG TPA: oligosaccharide flippase family protein, partial [Clostridia bacterium]|nr:oligosaccharide flippase family protein [Clostridia bacterium]
MAGVMWRLINAVVVLVSVPLTVRYLGSERYGLWMAIGSFVSLLSFADFGLGNGLMNKLAEAHGKGDLLESRRYISSTFFLLSALALFLGLLVAIAYPFVPWARAFNASSPTAVQEAGPTMLVISLCLLAGIPLGVVARIQMGYQEGFTNYLWSSAGALVGLCGVLLAVSCRTSLPILVLASVGSPVVVMFVNGIWLFTYHRPQLFPHWRHASLVVVRSILGTGSLFLIIQVASAVYLGLDNIIIAQLFGPAEVAEYSVANKLFSFFPPLMGMFLGALWPAYSEAKARGDFHWIKVTFYKSVRISFCAGFIVSLVLIAFARPIISLWVGKEM